MEITSNLAGGSYYRFVISKTYQRWRLPEHFVLSLALVALVVVLAYFDSLWDWDQVIYDWQIEHWSRPAAEDIVIVAIDERSLEALGRWPWPRSIHADLVSRLTEAGARVIGLDVVFAEADANDPDADHALATVVHESKRVVLPVVNSQRNLGGQLIEILPMKALASAAAKLGHVDRQLDRDAIARSAYLKAGLSEPHWPSFALAMLELAEPDQWQELPGLRSGVTGPKSPFSWVRDYQIWVPYAGPPGHFARVSYVDVVQEIVPPDLFKDNFVLVGATAAGLGDLLPTPVSGDRHPMPGVEVVANELDTLRKGLTILPLSRPWQVILAGILVFVPPLVYPRVPRWSLPLWVGFLLATVLISIFLLRNFQLWYPPAVALVALIISYVIWSWRRLVQTVRYLNQELIRLYEEPTIRRRGDTPDLTVMARLLEDVLPVAGCVLLDASDSIHSSWGEAPPVFTKPPQVGHWDIRGPAIWTAIQRRNETWRLGIHWRGAQAPTSAEQRLLSSLASHCEVPGDIKARTPVEFLQSRIQQVQEATERLQSMRRFITDTLAQLAHGVVVSDAMGHVLMSNSRAIDYLGIQDSESIYEQQLSDLLEKLQVTSDQTISNILQRVLLENRTVRVSARAPGVRDLLVQISPFAYEEDDLGGVIVNLADVTALRESERRRRDLMAFLSHDLRTPLASILAVTDIAKLKPEKLADPKYIANIEHNARRTLQLADDVLQLARAESVDVSSFEDIDLVQVASNALDAVDAQASAKQIQIHTRLPETVLLQGNAALLERAFTNLLSNAIKYSPDEAKVTLGIEPVNGKVQCWIQDTGYGIAEQDRPKLFARFKRIDRREHKHESGSGLGLAFVKTVVERHRGTIDVESELGEGTCIRLVLPNVKADL